MPEIHITLLGRALDAGDAAAAREALALYGGRDRGRDS